MEKRLWTVAYKGGAAPSLDYAASEMARHINMLSGERAVLSPCGERPHGRGCISLRLDLSMPEEDFALCANGGSLLVQGGTRGVLYGVYEALERFCKIEFLSPSFTCVPPDGRLSLPAAYREEFSPAFELRYPHWSGAINDGDFAARLKLNNPSLCERHGNPAPFFDGVLGSCHTFRKLIPPEEYFAEHPEYFSMVDGRRIRENTQLCLSNPDVLAIVTEKVLKRIEANPRAKYFGVSQNDWQGYCTCEKCAGIDAEEESHAGTLIRFVNKVAEEVEKRHPDKVVETLAYQYTRKPPRFARVRRNVMPCLCSIECDFSLPLDESPSEENIAFIRDLKGWAKQTDKLYLWDYTTDFAHYFHPFPNVFSLQGNIRLFRDNNVKSLFEQGCSQGEHADFAELKTWLLAKLMWNPDSSMEELLERFFGAFYGKASGIARKYFDMLHGTRKGPLSIYESSYSALLPDSFLEEAAKLWERACLLVKDDKTVLDNARWAKASVDYARLLRHRGGAARWEEYRELAKGLERLFFRGGKPARVSEAEYLDRLVSGDIKRYAALTQEEISSMLECENPVEGKRWCVIPMEHFVLDPAMQYEIRMLVKGSGYRAAVEKWDARETLFEICGGESAGGEEWRWERVATWRDRPGYYFTFSSQGGDGLMDRMSLVPLGRANQGEGLV